MNRKTGLIIGTILVLGIIVGLRMVSFENVGTITVGGLQRTYRVYVPDSLDESRAAPLIIALHGGGGSGRGMIDLTQGGFNTLADESGFVVVYPDAAEKNWNDGRGIERYRSQRENIDDVGFISALIDKLADQLNIDLNRVYVIGMSNGAIMSFRLACELSDKIAAIAPVCGSMPENFSAVYTAQRTMPVMMINGIDDPLVP